MFFQAATLWCIYMSVRSVESALLDPSLYLSPMPPLTETSDSMPPEILWSRSANPILDPRRTPSVQVEEVIKQSPTAVVEQESSSTKSLQPRAKLFWPSSLRASTYSASASVGTGSIQVPLTFSLSGLYGRYAPGAGTGIIASSYGTVSEVGGKAVAALAGTGYGRYGSQSGIRIYRGENGPAWSGWGNGKWGHYGKG